MIEKFILIALGIPLGILIATVWWLFHDL